MGSQHKLFFSDKKYANMRDEIGKEFRNNEFPNLLLHPEIIFQYMEYREINVVTWMQLLLVFIPKIAQPRRFRNFRGFVGF